MSTVKSSSEREVDLATVPTSADVARRANVSRATVSYVLNGVSSQKISDKTRKAVLRAADELGYRPNLAAQSLAAGASRIAMFVVPSVHLGELTIAISSRLTARAAERGVTLIVHFEGPGSRSVVEAAMDLRPRVVIGAFGLDGETTRALQQRQITIASLPPGGGQTLAGGDRTGWIQVEHLVARGHTRLAFADTTEAGLKMLARGRHDGVVDACRARGLATPAYEQFALDGRDADQKVRAWAEAGVTAVAAYNDEVAITVLAAIRRSGLRCPQDLAVIGVDDMAINGSMEPPLTSIAIDVDRMAVLYTDALLKIIDDDNSPVGEIDIDSFTRVVPRESTAGVMY
ncbi:MAG TPA: LacI family DNA-binding transcriptional regulator [Galbitalea sp.]